MRILCWGTYDTTKPRARILLEGLRLAGAQVEECHADIWRGVEDKSQVHGWGQRASILLRWLFAYPRLAWRLARHPKPDLILVGFPGVLDILVAAPIARMRSIPLVWDMFMSLYDTVVVDRKLLKPSSVSARFLRCVERFAFRRAKLVFLDTQTHARHVEQTLGVPLRSADAVWVGVETRHFSASSARAPVVPSQRNPHETRVLFYGQFIPLHGIETIIEAARLIANEPVHWHLVGRGQEAARIQALLDGQPLPSLTWDAWVPYDQLYRLIDEADVCLGIFGTSGKAASVIPNKVFQILAVGKPLITRDSDAIRELLHHAPPCVSLVPPGDPAALANAVRAFAASDRVPSHCHQEVAVSIDAAAIGRQCVDLIGRRLGMDA